MALIIFSILSMVAIDQLSKYIVALNLVTLGETAPLIPGVIQLRYVHNYGASFSILQGKQAFLIVITSIAICVLIYLLLSKKIKNTWEVIAFTMVVGGGIGNLVDRIMYGYVIDFFDLQFMNFAVFNVADCFVCVGVAIFFVYTIVTEYKKYKKLKLSKKENE